MSLKMLVIVVKFNMPSVEYIQAMKSLTAEILNVPGLRWKIWLINETQCTAGGLYLFDDSPSIESFLASPLVDHLKQHPAFTDILILPFAVLETETKATYGPLGAGVRV